MSSGVTQVNILIGTIIASFQTGAVSYLYYADRVYQINLAIAGIAVGTVSLPVLSKAFKSKNINKVSNPNGAMENIAGIYNQNKNILGMMPHPERVIDKSLSSDDGNFFFENLIENFK